MGGRDIKMDGMQRDYGPLLQETVQSHRRYTSLGQVASYIPELKGNASLPAVP